MYGLPQQLYQLTEYDFASPLVIPDNVLISAALGAVSSGVASRTIPQDQVFIAQRALVLAESSVGTERITDIRLGLTSAGGVDVGAIWREGYGTAALIPESVAAAAQRYWANFEFQVMFSPGSTISLFAQKDAAVGNLSLTSRMFGWFIPKSRFGRL